MTRRGSYLGGSTILKPWRNDADEGWEPQSVITGQESKNKKQKSPKLKYSPDLKRYATPFEVAYIEFSKQCKKADKRGVPRPDVPMVIRERYAGRDLQQLVKMIRHNRFYNNKKRRKYKTVIKKSDGA